MRLGGDGSGSAFRRPPARQGGCEALRRQLVGMGRGPCHAEGHGAGVSDGKKRIDTSLVKGGRRKEWTNGIVNPSVWRASTMLFDSVEALRASNPPQEGRLQYGRNGNPTTWA